MTEEWRVIDGFPDYAVSSLGKIKRLTSRTCAKAGSILRQCWSRANAKDRGYLTVDLCAGGKKSTKSVHILVIEAFKGRRPANLVPNHEDGDRSNNRASNLKWVTQSRNVKHAYELGLADAKGERNGQAKLTEPTILQIRALATGKRGQYAEIGRRFDISAGHAAGIIKRKAWPHI